MLWLSRWLPSHRPHCFSCCRETDGCGTVLETPDNKGGGNKPGWGDSRRDTAYVKGKRQMSYDKTYEAAQERRRLCEPRPWHCEGNAAFCIPKPKPAGRWRWLRASDWCCSSSADRESRIKGQGAQRQGQGQGQGKGLDKGRFGWRMREPQLHRRRH